MNEATPAGADAEKRARQREYERKYRESHRTEDAERSRRYRLENPEKVQEQKRRSREKSQDKIKAYKKAYRAANSERIAQQEREYREANRERILPLKRRRGRASYQEIMQDPDRAEALRATQRRYREANRHRISALERTRKHGLTPEGWTALWTAQDGRCYLCQRQLSADDAVIEHDHRCCPRGASCAVCRRGLACGPCNLAVGMVDDDPERLLVIAANLRVAMGAVTERMKRKAVQGALFGEDGA